MMNAQAATSTIHDVCGIVAWLRGPATIRTYLQFPSLSSYTRII
jgi:hypothetical protein